MRSLRFATIIGACLGLAGVVSAGPVDDGVVRAVRLLLGDLAAELPGGALEECAGWAVAHAHARLGRGPVDHWMWPPAILAHLLERAGIHRLAPSNALRAEEVLQMANFSAASLRGAPFRRWWSGDCGFPPGVVVPGERVSNCRQRSLFMRTALRPVEGAEAALTAAVLDTVPATAAAPRSGPGAGRVGGGAEGAGPDEPADDSAPPAPPSQCPPGGGSAEGLARALAAGAAAETEAPPARVPRDIGPGAGCVRVGAEGTGPAGPVDVPAPPVPTPSLPPGGDLALGPAHARALETAAVVGSGGTDPVPGVSPLPPLP